MDSHGLGQWSHAGPEVLAAAESQACKKSIEATGSKTAEQAQQWRLLQQQGNHRTLIHKSNSSKTSTHSSTLVATMAHKSCWLQTSTKALANHCKDSMLEGSIVCDMSLTTNFPFSVIVTVNCFASLSG
jgi:hypothetical protein